MKAMLKGALVALGLAATMAMGLQAASAADDSLLQKILNRGTLRVGTTGDYPRTPSSIRPTTPTRATRSMW